MTIEEFMSEFTKQMEKKNILVLTGAGISTPSGIKDFRGANGIYKDAEDGISILTSGYLEEHPEEFYRFYRKYILTSDDIKPNLAHEVLADLENDGYIRALYTQNIDGLHQAAGSKNVIELHGGTSFSCINCKKEYSYDEVKNMDFVPHCTECGSLIRPNIVFYNESYKPGVLDQADNDFMYAKTLLIIGTGLEIYPIRVLVHHFIETMHLARFNGKDKKLFLINMGPTSIDGFKEDVIKYDGDVMDFARSLKKYRDEKNK
ncbi:MAG: NAD-dependent protein deacylase [Bacilli bacterium]|nr:NAD-dependent protein deacylase [Bacilli bacterium]